MSPGEWSERLQEAEVQSSKKNVDLLLKLFRFVMFLRFIWWFHFCWVFVFWHLYLRCWFQPLYKRRTAQITSPTMIGSDHANSWCVVLYFQGDMYLLPYCIRHWDPYCWWFRNPANTRVPVSQFVGNLLYWILHNPSKKGVNVKNHPISISFHSIIDASFLSTSYPKNKNKRAAGTTFEGKDGVFRVEGHVRCRCDTHGRRWCYEINQAIDHQWYL